MRPLSISKQITIRESPSLSRYLNEISQIPMITEEEEVQLAIRIRNGEGRAMEKLVKSNLRFVVSVAKQYQSRGLGLHDLINEGNLGLVKAATKFDETYGFKFISYAVWWIRQGIIQALSEKSRMVRLPLNKINAIKKIKTVSSNFEQIHLRKPLAEEISEVMDSTLSEIQFCLRHSSWLIPLDEPLKMSDGEVNLHDKIQSKDFENPDRTLVKQSLKIDIDSIFEVLSYRETYIIKMYYGIGVNDSLRIQEIAVHLDLTTERVRQIKKVALTRLRNSSKMEFLKEYL
ncbi:sigma-70 family RNA polymerase sigma factor [Muricauda sp. JGD-17]|uniref:Sigma-70 family RNA polymerase sigma factor n=1 Tax=Flagellimonas ochracea TaxID=2696472 RepID=A0A964WWM0_9FLAO|nr:RNA polymerase sigma factor RpoD/SigA [Allomuricauda ochracea]NAY91211.1 sigma-70 family RNA polymerase sigma factor [Allomuricauda ochracea]